MRLITSDTKICMVIGYPLAGSLSPLMHNTAYEELKISDKFVYTAARVRPEDLGKAIAGAKALGIRGISCTMPHKQSVIEYLDAINEVAERIGAVNTVVNEDGKLIGYNTDWLGVVTPLSQLTSLKGKRVAIIGAGGAARAAAFGLTQQHALVKIFNRSIEKAEALAKDVKCPFADLSTLDEFPDFDVIINCTPVGMYPHDRLSVLSPEHIRPNQIVFDTVYTPTRTKLIDNAEKQGARIIHGIEMLLYQGVAQFELYTDLQAPTEAMRAALKSHLEAKK